MSHKSDKAAQRVFERLIDEMTSKLNCSELEKKLITSATAELSKYLDEMCQCLEISKKMAETVGIDQDHRPNEFLVGTALAIHLRAYESHQSGEMDAMLNYELELLEGGHDVGR